MKRVKVLEKKIPWLVLAIAAGAFRHCPRSEHFSGILTPHPPSPVLVDEGAASQLSAIATMDDDSAMLLTGSTVNWMVAAGPVTQISGAGLAQMGFVYQITLANVRGDYLGTTGSVQLAVINAGNDDFAECARDGLDDAWQAAYFGEHNPSANPSADPDGDGYSNLAEHMAGTDPLDPHSHFRMRILPRSGPGFAPQIGFSPRRADRIYLVEKREFLSEGTFLPLAVWRVDDDSFERVVTDLAATNRSSFYRVRISRP